MSMTNCQDWNCKYSPKGEAGYCFKHTKENGYRVLLAYDQLSQSLDRVVSQSKSGGVPSAMTERQIEGSKYSLRGLTLINYKCYLWCLKQPNATHMSTNGSNAVLLTDQDITDLEEELEGIDYWTKRRSNIQTILNYKKRLVVIPEINLEAIRLGKEVEKNQRTLVQKTKELENAEAIQSQWQDTDWISQQIMKRVERTSHLDEEVSALTNLLEKTQLVLGFTLDPNNLETEPPESYSMPDLLVARMRAEKGIPSEEE